MNKFSTLIIAGSILILGLAGSACTGFAEGPALSFVSTSKKLSTVWQVKEAALHGVDITETFKSDFFDFREDGDYKRLDATRSISLPPYTQDTFVSMIGEGEWNLLDKNTLELFYEYEFPDTYNSNFRYTEELYERWEIARLTEDRLWLRNDSMLLKMEFFVQ